MWSLGERDPVRVSSRPTDDVHPVRASSRPGDDVWDTVDTLRHR